MRKRFTRIYLPYPVLFVFLFLGALSSSAQYFGRNKVLYDHFEFRVYETPHFEWYHYLRNHPKRNRLARAAEHWYALHQSVLGDTFRSRNPVILYNHHADFQQTRAVQGEIRVGTGGVTESLKNRVVMPLMESNAQTDHVLGHELVHAFQYRLLKDSLNSNAMNNLPLWMVEGMAEYMSCGYVDGNTAMWLRSAVANNVLPRLKDLTTKPDEYFPYRWGQAFWAYVTATYGDSIIKRLFLESARKGYAAAIKKLLNTDEKSLSIQWQQSIQLAYAPYLKTKNLDALGTSLINKKNSGKMNLLPSISPDGKFIAFWTEKNLFSLDLYIADAQTGKLLKRVTSNSYNAHIDQYSALESSVAWSPDSKKIAFVAFAKGHNRLLIAGRNGRIEEAIDLPGLSAFSNPAWSPDGKALVVTGLEDGQADLYVYTLSSKRIRQLTDDACSELLPSWSPDGQYIVFSTDQEEAIETTARHQFSHAIAVLHIPTGLVTKLPCFPGANNLNPVFSPQGKSIYFLSDRNGFRDLYSYHLEQKEIHQHTRFFTGISGITSFAPALSISTGTGQLVYNFYNNREYIIFSALPAQLEKIAVKEGDSNREAAFLPPWPRNGNELVQENLAGIRIYPDPPIQMKEKPYRSRFRLDHVGSSGVGVQAGGFNPGLAGGGNAVFTDMAGNHLLFAALSLNGEIFDVAGQFAYVNQKYRFNWGASFSHIPYLSGAQYVLPDTFVHADGDSVAAWNHSLDLLRTFEDQLSLFASYPFSPVRRVEAGVSFSRYYYRLDRYTEYYDKNEGYYLGSHKQKMPVPHGFSLVHGYAAFVGDNSSFGVASPLEGHRFRFEAAQYFGLVKMTSLLGDYRKYFRFAPVTLATRSMFMGRYGTDAAGHLLPPLFLGYTTLVRGYDALGYAGQHTTTGLTINHLIGSKILVGNVELRVPLTGPERLAFITSRFFFSELGIFTDGGLAWGRSSFISNPEHIKSNNRLILSTGLSLRVNLFGYLVIEPYYAIPWNNGGWDNKTFGLNILPGW